MHYTNLNKKLTIYSTYWTTLIVLNFGVLKTENGIELLYLVVKRCKKHVTCEGF
jgi:hypothetical protein